MNKSPTVLYQLHAIGPTDGGWNGKTFSKKVFLTREAAEKYKDEWISLITNPSSTHLSIFLHEGLHIAIVELEVGEMNCADIKPTK